MNDIQNLGALIDTRPEEKKMKDFHFVEAIASAGVAPVKWIEKGTNPANWRRFPDQDQDGSGSCVANTIKKLGNVMVKIKEGGSEIFSATSIYTHRSNKPQGGMIGVEAFDIWKEHGLALESTVPSHDLSDAQMDAIVLSVQDKEVAKAFAIAGHLGIANQDFETVASVIQETGKGVMTWFYFTSAEWSPKFPVVLGGLDLYGAQTARHSVAAVDFGLINGKKYIKIEDSAHFGGLTERWISEEFFHARNWFNRYAMNFKFDDQSAPLPNNQPNAMKPKYNFTTPLVFIPLDSKGNISDLAKNAVQKVDVIALQDIMKFEGFFPLNVSSTGYYGAMTAKAVYNYQVKYSVAPLSELDGMKPIKGARVGEKTINSLNSNYGI